MKEIIPYGEGGHTCEQHSQEMRIGESPNLMC